ncbi:MAG: flagellar export chaperone FlgN [Oscillospiraceae bacterium]|nr:flagellar export chaperone FlgN [Oscillospiraceae bacterium]
MDTVINTARVLAQTLTQLHEEMLCLMQCALEKEKALREDDITLLKDIIEREEDIVGACALLEKKRIAQTAQLVSGLGLGEEEASLRRIAEMIADEDIKSAMLEVGDKLNETISALRDKNDMLSEVIKLKNDYAEVVLEALTTGDDTARNYNASGMIEKQSEDSPGVVEFFA